MHVTKYARTFQPDIDPAGVVNSGYITIGVSTRIPCPCRGVDILMQG